MPDITLRSINELMKRTGYHDSPEGQCYGVMSCARQAILLGETYPFALQLLLALETDLDESVRQVMLSRALTQSAELSKWRDLDSLLRKISCYQAPNKHLNPATHLEFQQQTFARTEQDYPDLLDERLIALGGISESSFSGFYMGDELDRYLSTLEQLITNTAFPVAIALSSIAHTLTITYDRTRKQWYFFNEGIPGLIEPENIAEAVREGFNLPLQSENLILKTTLFVTNKDREPFVTIIEEWKSGETWQDLHRPCEEKAKAIDGLNTSWLDIATSQNDTDLMGHLLKLGANAADPLQSGLPVIAYAIMNGYAKSVQMLAKLMSPEQKNAVYKGISSIHLAILYGRHELIDIMAHSGFNLELRATSISPLEMAVYTHRKEAVNALLTYGCNPNNALENQPSPLEWALVGQDRDILQLLLDSGARFRSNPFVFCIQKELDISLDWMLTHFKAVPTSTWSHDRSLIDKLLGPDNLPNPVINRRKELFLATASQQVNLYQLACILGKGKLMSCFIRAGLAPDVFGNPLYQNVSAFIRANKDGDQDSVQKAKDCQFMLLCFGEVKEEQLPDELKQTAQASSSTASPPMQEPVDKKPRSIPGINNPYQYGKKGHTRIVQLFRAQAPAQALQVVWSLPGSDQMVTLPLVEAQSDIRGDALKRQILKAVSKHLDNLLAGHYGEPAEALVAFEASFRRSDANNLLNSSQGVMTSIRSHFGFYPTDSRRALDQIFNTARQLTDPAHHQNRSPD